MLGPDAFDDHVVPVAGELVGDRRQFLELGLACDAVVDDLRDQSVPPQGALHRALASQHADTPDRHPWLLHRVADRRERGGLDREVGARVLERLTLPQATHDIETLVHQFRPDLPVTFLAERIHPGVDRAEPDRQGDPPVAEPIDRCDLAGEFGRPTTRWRCEHRAEPDLRGAHGRQPETDPGVDPPHRLPDEDAVPAVLFGDGGEFPDLVSVGPWNHEAEPHTPDVRPIVRCALSCLRSPLCAPVTRRSWRPPRRSPGSTPTRRIDCGGCRRSPWPPCRRQGC